VTARLKEQRTRVLTVGNDQTTRKGKKMKKTLMVGLVIALTMFAFSGFAADKPKAKEKATAPTDLIMKVLEQWKAAAAALEFDKALALYSDKFSSYEYGDKAGLKSFLNDTKSQGDLAGMAVDTTKAKVEIDKKKGTATVTGIEVKAKFGSAAISLDMAKEKDNWLIKGMDVQMQ